ncbi:MAG: ankyrin repeat domain-containing protein [Pirellulaceae bacterium]|nr:ankyrin repeat domain-containing protein [Pirellulaceae bacterium]
MTRQRVNLSVAVGLFAVLFLSGLAQASNPDLADAVEAQEFDTATRLLKSELDVNATQPDGMTALHWAIHHNELELAKLLVDRGARIEVKTRYGVTPLFLACQSGHHELVQWLLTSGANPNTALPNGETVLMTAARTGRVAPVKALIAASAEVNAREKKEQTALMWASAAGNTEVVDELIKAGADLKATLSSGFSALFFAVREGHTDVVLRLLKAGCDVNSVMNTQSNLKFSRGRLSTTPMILAVENGHFELGKKLIDVGADPNAHPSGYTALHALTWVRKPIRGDGDPPPRGSGKVNSLDMVRILATSGADLNARSENGKSELGRFTYTGSTPLLLAAQASDLTLVKLLVQLGADPNITNSDGTSPLLAASGVGALGDGDESAGTEEETIATIDYLLTLGADINAVDNNGETAMHGAAYQSLAKLVSFLSQHGADVEAWHRENRAGWTPLVIAEGFRPGNFRPSPDTISAIKSALRAANVQAPEPIVLKEHLRSWSTVRNEDKAWVIKNVQYAKVDNKSLLLDLHFPERVAGSALIVWVHGGAWRGGSKDDMPLGQLVKAGYSVASVNYRLSTEAKFPAQIHDIKAAIRFLRQIALRYKYRSDRIAIAGSSAGGHLAALVGTTNNHKDLEGEIGTCLKNSSEVHAIIDLYGPTNLMTILSQSTPHGLSVRKPALDLLLGAQPENVPDLAKLASPVEHVDATDPPLLMIHGDQDPQVPINQSHELAGKYRQLARPIQFEVIQGGEHGGKSFYDDQRQELMKRFLGDQLQAN